MLALACSIFSSSWPNGVSGKTRRLPRFSSDLQRGSNNAEMHLVPLAELIYAIVFGLHIAFTRHLDAGAVYQQMQTRCGRCDPGQAYRPAPSGGENSGERTAEVVEE